MKKWICSCQTFSFWVDARNPLLWAGSLLSPVHLSTHSRRGLFQRAKNGRTFSVKSLSHVAPFTRKAEMFLESAGSKFQTHWQTKESIKVWCQNLTATSNKVTQMGLPHTDKPTPTSKFSISGILPYLLVENAWRGDGQSVSAPLPGCTGRRKTTRESKFSKSHCIEEIYRIGFLIPILPRSLLMHPCITL